MTSAQPAVDVARRLQMAARTLENTFLGKSEVIRLMMVTTIAGEHMVLVGPPGTAKSALVRLFAKLVQAHYFEYLLTRFTEPNELFGPIDIQKFREGKYERRMEGMLPEAEIAFLDEIFKANSAILNSLLSVLNRAHLHGRRATLPRSFDLGVWCIQRSAERRRLDGRLRPFPPTGA